MSAITNNNSNYAAYGDLGLTEEEQIQLAILQTQEEEVKEEKKGVKRKEPEISSHEDEDAEFLKVIELSKKTFENESKIQKTADSKDTKEHKGEEKKPVEVLKLLTPTVGESWVDKKISGPNKFALDAVLAFSRAKIIKKLKDKNMSSESIAKIEKLKIKTLNTLGDAEKFALDIINRDAKTNEERIRQHQKLKDVLIAFEQKGISAVKDAIKD